MLKIMGLLSVVNGIRLGELDNFNIISIRDSASLRGNFESYNLIDDNIKEDMIHRIVMDDVQNGDPFIERFILPNEDLIRSALDFASERENIIVHCTAGVSRSSALAFLIECQRTRDPEKAIRLLNSIFHFPNRFVVEIGEKIIGMNTLPTIDKFLQEGVDIAAAMNEEKEL